MQKKPSMKSKKTLDKWDEEDDYEEPDYLKYFKPHKATVPFDDFEHIYRKWEPDEMLKSKVKLRFALLENY